MQFCKGPLTLPYVVTIDINPVPLAGWIQRDYRLEQISENQGVQTTSFQNYSKMPQLYPYFSHPSSECIIWIHTLYI